MSGEGYDRRVVWLARIGALLVRVLGWTWRYRVIDDASVRRARAAKQPIVFTLWHGQLLPLLVHHRRQGVAVLISEHGDGEIIARIATSLGYRTIRGSTSRGAARALVGLERALRDGHDLAITPDGPRGPAHSFAPGALIVAQRAAAPLIPAAVWVASAWRLKSWDGFVIPRPFSRINVAYGDALVVERDRAQDAAADAPLARAAMLATEERARA